MIKYDKNVRYEYSSVHCFWVRLALNDYILDEEKETPEFTDYFDKLNNPDMDEKSEMDIIKDIIKERKQDLLKQLIVKLSSIKVILLICNFRAVNGGFFAVLALNLVDFDWIRTGSESYKKNVSIVQKKICHKKNIKKRIYHILLANGVN